MKFAMTHVDLFGRSVLCCTECSEVDAIQYFIKYSEKKNVEIPPDLKILGNCAGWCQTTGGDIYVWEKGERYSVLLHEVVHAAWKLCEVVDIIPSEELICRLVEYLKVELLDALVDHDIMTEQKFLDLLPAIRTAAKEHGYAVGLHGSLARDFDIIAVAWTPTASPPDDVAMAIKIAAGGMRGWRVFRDQGEPKPHGRLCYAFDFDKCEQNNRGYCDLSVVPPTTSIL